MKPYQDHSAPSDAGKAVPHPRRTTPLSTPASTGRTLCAPPFRDERSDVIKLPRIGGRGFVDSRRNPYTVDETGRARRSYGQGHSKDEREMKRTEREQRVRALRIVK